jgi:hypothetical protein
LSLANLWTEALEPDYSSPEFPKEATRLNYPLAVERSDLKPSMGGPRQA